MTFCTEIVDQENNEGIQFRDALQTAEIKFL